MSEITEVLGAVSRAMGCVRKIERGGTNTHDRYDFASIDDFLAALNPICADAGLVFHMQETSCEEFTRKSKFSENAWIKLTFAITVYHVSGQSLPPVFRSVEVIRTGAQSYGSAQSYALKQFLRSLLLVPTGDKDDADYGEKGEGAVERHAHPRTDNRLASGEADRIAAEVHANTHAAALIDAIERCETEQELMTLWVEAKADSRKELLRRPDVTAAKDAAKARLMQPDPFSDAE